MKVLKDKKAIKDEINLHKPKLERKNKRNPKLRKKLECK